MDRNILKHLLENIVHIIDKKDEDEEKERIADI